MKDSNNEVNTLDLDPRIDLDLRILLREGCYKFVMD